MHRLLPAMLVFVSGAASGAGGESSVAPDTIQLTLRDALVLAADRAPATLLARSRVEVARGELLGFEPWLADNPRASVASGVRLKPAGPTVDVDAALSQAFELGGQQGARRDAAHASIARAEALADDVARRSLADVGDAFITASSAEARAALARANLEHAQRLLTVASKRAAAGEAAGIDTQLAKAGLARAAAEVSSAGADRESAITQLRQLLGFDGRAVMVIDVDASSALAVSAAASSGAQRERADVRALRAERERALAERRAAEGSAWPTVEGQAGYAVDDGDNVVRAGVSVPIPLFQRGQGAAAAAGAEAAALDVEIAALVKSAEAERLGAVAVLQQRSAAVAAFKDAVDAAAESVALATRSYEAGEASLAQLLLVEREALSVRQEEIILRADEARAELAVVVVTGVVP